jgi:outer membrane protein
VPTGDFVGSTGEDIFTRTGTPVFRDKSFTDQFADNENKSIRFSLTIPIFNRFSARIGVKRALIQEQVADLNYESAKLSLRQNIESAHNDAASALKRYKAAEKSVSALEPSYAYTQERYNVAIINSFHFNNEKNRLMNAQSELLQAKYNYIFSTKVLDFYQGGGISLSK